MYQREGPDRILVTKCKLVQRFIPDEDLCSICGLLELLGYSEFAFYMCATLVNIVVTSAVCSFVES